MTSTSGRMWAAWWMVLALMAGMTARPAGAQQTAPAVSLWVESPGTMILHERTPGTRRQIELSGAGNEMVAAQLALRSGQDVAGPCTFEWTGLKDPQGHEIARDNIVLYRAADIEVTHLSHDNRAKDPARARTLGLFPDALVPLVRRDGVNVANSIKLEKETTLAFWVDIRIPAAVPAGQYTGSITLSGAGAAINIPLKVTALDIQIPADSTIPSLYNLRTHPHVAANMDAYVAETMAHRLQPTNYHYGDMFARQQALMDKYNPDGKGFVSIMFSDSKPPSDARQKEIVDILTPIAEHLKERGLLERSFIQLNGGWKSDLGR